MTYYETRVRQVIPKQVMSIAKEILPESTRARLHDVSKSVGLRVGRATSWQRCLPNFLIIGAMRSGTTTLYNLTCATRAAIPAVKKEVHYFDNNYHRKLAWYRSHFCTIRRRDRIHAAVGQPVACGEASPYYLFHPDVPSRVASVIPNVRLVAILRNPIDRAYSHYWHVRDRGDEDRSFDRIVEEDLANGPKKPVESTAREAGSAGHQWLTYFDRGLYVRQLMRWLQHFQRNQLLLLKTSELQNQPGRVLTKVTKHLGQDPEAVVPDGLTLAKRQNSNSYPQMSSSSRSLLEEFYGDWETEIEASIGWN